MYQLFIHWIYVTMATVRPHEPVLPLLLPLLFPLFVDLIWSDDICNIWVERSYNTNHKPERQVKLIRLHLIRTLKMYYVFRIDIHDVTTSLLTITICNVTEWLAGWNLNRNAPLNTYRKCGRPFALNVYYISEMESCIL